MDFIAGFLLSFILGFMLPSTYRGRPCLSVMIVLCRRNRWLKWLAWQMPLMGDDTWYFDIVERDVFK